MMWWINKHKLPLLMFLFFVLYHSMPSGNVYGSEIWHGIFWWLNFGPGIFGGWRGRGCVWGPGDFWGVWFLPPFDHSRQDKTRHVTWNPEWLAGGGGGGGGGGPPVAPLRNGVTDWWRKQVLIQNTSCIRNPQVISEGRGDAHSLYPPPRSAPEVGKMGLFCSPGISRSGFPAKYLDEKSSLRSEWFPYWSGY